MPNIYSQYETYNPNTKYIIVSCSTWANYNFVFVFVEGDTAEAMGWATGAPDNWVTKSLSGFT